MVSKKDSSVRIINLVTRLNRVTIRDTLLLGGYDEFFKTFTSYQIITGVDLFSRYNHYILAVRSKDLTAFATLFRVLK